MRKNTQELARAEIMFLDKMLPDVGEDAMRFLANPFGFSICSGKYGKRAEKNNTYWCYDCGAEFSFDEIKEFRDNPEYIAIKAKNPFTFYGLKYLGVCPHCGKPMKIDDWRYHKRTLEDVVAINATMGDWQITRYFNERLYCRPGRKADIVLQDIGADWTKDGYTHHYVSRIGGMYYSKFWKEETRHFADNSIGAELGDVTEHYDMPDFSLEKELTRRGIDLGNLHGLKLTQILSYMQDDPHFETLWKQGDWQIAKFFKKDLHYYWDYIRIARNHGYILNNENLVEWRDLINMLGTLGRDRHNPFYICPENLHDAHNALTEEVHRRRMADMERWRRQADEEARERARIAMLNRAEKNEEFIKRREKYFGIGIDGKGFKIVCLKSIDEFENEGNTLHHCVFACGYYQKDHSLILSARDADNNPIETIEIDLRSFKILQCYGMRDTFSPLHNKIVKAMKDNMWQVEELAGKKVSVAC